MVAGDAIGGFRIWDFSGPMIAGSLFFCKHAPHRSHFADASFLMV